MTKKGHPDGCPFSFRSLDHVVAADEVGLGHVGVNLSGVDVAVAKHALDDLDGDAGAEADGGGKGMPGAVGGELFTQIHLFAEDGELPIVAYVGAVWQLEVVLFEDVQDDGQ